MDPLPGTPVFFEVLVPDPLGRNLHIDKGLYCVEAVDESLAGKGHRLAGAPGSSGPANAMDIVFRVFGKVVVYHHVEVVDVETPGGDVGSHQILQLSFL